MTKWFFYFLHNGRRDPSLRWAFKKGWTNHWPSFNWAFGWNLRAHKWNAHPNQVFYFQLENKSRSLVAIFEVFLTSVWAELGVIHESLLISAHICYHKWAHYRAKPKACRPQWAANKVEDAICMNSARNERPVVGAGQRKAPLGRAKGWKITV